MSTDYFDDVELVPLSSPVVGATTSEIPKDAPARREVKAKAQEVGAPPFSLESEQGVIACCLMDGLPVMAKIPWLRKEHFYDLRLGSVYEVMLEMQSASQAVDLLSVSARLKSLEMLEGCGGLPFLSGLLDAVPSSSNLPTYADTVRDCARRREILKACREVVLRVEHDHGMDANEAAGMMAAGLARADQLRVTAEPVPLQEHLQETLARYSAIAAGSVTPGIYHGFRSAHSILPMLRYGEEYLIAGRPSGGKTSMALTIALNAAQVAQPGERVAVMSLETPVQGIIDRAIGCLGGVEPRKVQMFSERDHKALALAAGRLRRLPLIIEYGPWGLRELLDRMTELVEKHGVRLFVIDYVELVEAVNRRATYRDQITEIAKAIKRFTKRYNVAMILLAQLSRECEKENRRPRMSDLGESSGLEKEADIVWLISKPKAELFEVPVVTMDTYIDKQRDGATGRVQLLFEKMFFRFSDVPEEMLEENTPHT